MTSGWGAVAVAVALVMIIGGAGEAHGAEVSSATSDRQSYHPGDIATLTAVVYANNGTLSDIQVLVNCPSPSACPLGGVVISSGLVAAPGIPPQFTMRQTANITQGQSATFTGQVQIGQVPAGNYTIQFNAIGPANKSHVQPIYAVASLSIEVSSPLPSSGGTGLSSLEVALTLVVVAVVGGLLVIRELGKHRQLPYN